MRLKEIRNSRKLTQQQVADLLSIPLRTYQNYERGINEPDTAILCKMADYYGVSVDYLVGYSNVSAQFPLTDMPDDEIELLDTYRQMSDTDKNVIMRVAKALAHVSTAKGQ